MNPAAASFSLSYELSPVILTNGIASGVVGGAIPIISLLQGNSFSEGLLGSGDSVSIDNAFAVFIAVAGSSLINNDVGLYPFANQQTAANAIVTKPLGISFKMLCPAKQPGDYGGNNLAIMTALQAALAQHNITGGTYTLVTPTYVWTDAIMTGMRDISGGETKQLQYAWQLDFIKPLVTLAEAQQAQNNLMSKISGGAPVNGQPAWSGPSTSPASVQAPSSVPAAQRPSGGNYQTSLATGGTVEGSPVIVENAAVF